MEQAFSFKFQFFLLIFFLSFPFSCDGTHSKIKSQMKMIMSSNTLSLKHFKPGVSADALPDAIHYNKYIPLIFNLKVPEWSSETLKLNSSFHCSSDMANRINNPLCPVAYHLDRLLAPIGDSMRFSKNIYTPTEGK